MLASRATWSTSVAAVLLVGLLALFHQVVRGAVRLGDARREATALHNAALFRCKALTERRPRESCLHQLDAAPPDIVALRAQNALPIAALEQRHR
jgi:hypothetical protein